MALQLGQLLQVDGDAGGLHIGQHVLHRQLHVTEQCGGVDAFQLGVQRIGQIRHGPRTQDRRLDRLLVHPVHVIEKRKLLLLRCIRAQFAAQVTQRKVVQGEAALPRPHQIGRQRRVGGDAVECPAAAREVVDSQLGFVQRFGFRRIGEPVRQRLVVGRSQRLGIDVTAFAVGRGDSQRGGVPVVGQVGTHDGEPGPPPVAGVRGQPWPDSAGFQRTAAHVETLVDLRLDGHQGVEQAVPQYPELEIVEEAVDLVAVPRPQAQRVRRLRQRHVADQLGEIPVADHAGQVLPQRVADLAAHRVDLVDQLLQRAVLDDPLRSGLLPQSRNAGQVVAGIASQSGEVGILRRGQAVLFDDGIRGEAGEFADAFDRVEHRDVVADQLQRVAVTGDHQDPVALVFGLGGQRRNDVVGLESGLGEHRDAQRDEHFLGDVDLTVELVGRR